MSGSIRTSSRRGGTSEPTNMRTSCLLQSLVATTTVHSRPSAQRNVGSAYAQQKHDILPRLCFKPITCASNGTHMNLTPPTYKSLPDTQTTGCTHRRAPLALEICILSLQSVQTTVLPETRAQTMKNTEKHGRNSTPTAKEGVPDSLDNYLTRHHPYSIGLEIPMTLSHRKQEHPTGQGPVKCVHLHFCLLRPYKTPPYPLPQVFFSGAPAILQTPSGGHVTTSGQREAYLYMPAAYTHLHMTVLLPPTLKTLSPSLPLSVVTPRFVALLGWGLLY